MPAVAWNDLTNTRTLLLSNKSRFLETKICIRENAVHCSLLNVALNFWRCIALGSGHGIHVEGGETAFSMGGSRMAVARSSI
jgi:hypothetical protein